MTLSSHTIPAPPPMRFLGQFGHLLSFMRDPIGFMSKLHCEYGEIAALAEGNAEQVFVFAPKYNRQVLGDAERFHTIPVPFPIPEGSALARLFTIPGQMNGSQNRRQRGVMFSALHKRYYQHYRDSVVSLTEKKIASWRIGEQRDLVKEMSTLTFATPCLAIFGLNPEQEGKTIVQLLEEWGDMLLARATTLLPFTLPGLPYRHLLRLSERLEKEYRALIAGKRANGLGADALSMLIKLHDEDRTHLSDAELIGQMNNLFNAGNTSRATILTWTLFLLSQHPKALLSVREELSSQLKLKGNAPTIEQLNQLPTLEGVIKESMRLLPPINWFSRRAMTSTQLGVYHIPKGAIIICTPFVTHRLPELYPQPNHFLPERWQSIDPDPYSYIPFGAGPRMCVGYHIAMLEMKLILAIILQRYHLTPPAGARIDRTGIMLTAPKEMPMLIGAPDGLFIRNEVQGNIRSLVALG